MNEETKKYLKKIGSKGGNTTKKKHGPGHFSKIGKLGGRPKKKAKAH